MLKFHSFDILGPREQLNQATAYLDGSTIYGYSESRANHLRSGIQGQLRMLRIGGRELLPPSTDNDDGCNTEEMNKLGRYCFETGNCIFKTSTLLAHKVFNIQYKIRLFKNNEIMLAYPRTQSNPYYIK